MFKLVSSQKREISMNPKWANSLDILFLGINKMPSSVKAIFHISRKIDVQASYQLANKSSTAIATLWYSSRHLASESECPGFESWLCQVDAESLAKALYKHFLTPLMCTSSTRLLAVCQSDASFVMTAPLQCSPGS